MSHRLVATAALIAAVCFSLAGQAPSSASKAPAKKAYTPPKTPWGDPDLQGLWPGNMNIPFERPKSFGTRATLTEAEFAQRLKQFEAQSGRAQSANANEGAGAHAPANWREYFPPTRQASLVVDPPDGRVPAMLPEAQKRINEMRGGLGPADILSPEKRADSWLDFDLWGRCITRGVIGSMLPSGLYNMGNQIVQAPGYIAIRNEMVHETRVIPLDGRVHVGNNIRTYMGDGRGRWEGTTLVIETTNMTNQTKIGSVVGGFGPHSDSLKLVERFTRISANELNYDVTVDDPKTWARPWTIHIPYKMDNEYPIYEYACHEANYGMLDIIKGARAEGR
jgi:hypothetical protein